MMPTKCRLCRAADANSEEHLFQSSIGGRRKVFGVLCAICNARLGRTIDASLARDFECARNLLVIETDRGLPPSIKVSDAKGQSLILRPGGLTEPAEARPDFVQVDGQTKRWVVNSVRPHASGHRPATFRWRFT
jgi:hypothetical protein